MRNMGQRTLFIQINAIVCATVLRTLKIMYKLVRDSLILSSVKFLALVVKVFKLMVRNQNKAFVFKQYV
jgi:hypothetical protein